MPIPDAVAKDPDIPEQAAQDLKKAVKTIPEVIDICNAFLSKQINCKNLCMACKEGCEELKAWEALENNEK